MSEICTILQNLEDYTKIVSSDDTIISIPLLSILKTSLFTMKEDALQAEHEDMDQGTIQGEYTQPSLMSSQRGLIGNKEEEEEQELLSCSIDGTTSTAVIPSVQRGWPEYREEEDENEKEKESMMDPAKLQAVMDWQEPHSLKGANPKLWSEEVSKAFTSIKSHFASAPILHRPDVDKPFLLEVDASSVGAGAVLYQKDAQGRKHPCFFFSKTFTPAERNYSIGDRELLAMKLAFSEWRHLLEGARFPFQVYTDHKNLVYLQTAQRLNSRQARWS
ncbi:uncharacterized protein, partial [Ranitomeya imitator]|uniref:uncharacterized protein n=1 Tax=Ranitomeya imitator TaxID=111125 RepID=UPI0037E74BF8